MKNEKLRVPDCDAPMRFPRAVTLMQDGEKVVTWYFGFFAEQLFCLFQSCANYWNPAQVAISIHVEIVEAK